MAHLGDVRLHLGEPFQIVAMLLVERYRQRKLLTMACWTRPRPTGAAVTATAARLELEDVQELLRQEILGPREGLRRRLESEPAFEVVAEAADGVQALQVVREIKPDVLLLNVAMPRMGGIETLAALETAAARVVLLTAGIEQRELVRAIQLGARGVILKDSATRQLIEGIHRVMDGKYVIGAGVADDLAQAVRQVGAPPTRRYDLTTRELEVVQAIVAGASNGDISKELSISLPTVKHHLTSIFDKTGASSRLELALFAIRHGLVQPE